VTAYDARPPAEPRAPRCNGRCNQPLVPHSSHLFIDGHQLPLRTERDGATVWLPSGQMIWRRKPDAIRKLKLDARHHLANTALEGERA
jgi:hypothetical protein